MLYFKFKERSEFNADKLPDAYVRVCYCPREHGQLSKELELSYKRELLSKTDARDDKHVTIDDRLRYSMIDRKREMLIELRRENRECFEKLRREHLVLFTKVQLSKVNEEIIRNTKLPEVAVMSQNAYVNRAIHFERRVAERRLFQLRQSRLKIEEYLRKKLAEEQQRIEKRAMELENFCFYHYTLKIHKNSFMKYSKYFARHLINRNFIVVRDISPDLFSLLIKFMYKGEIWISPNDIASFAHQLRVFEIKNNYSVSATVKPSELSDPYLPIDLSKRPEKKDMERITVHK